MKQFPNNNKLSNIDIIPDDCMSKQDILRTKMNKFKIHDKIDMSETDDIMHIVENLSEKNEVAVKKWMQIEG